MIEEEYADADDQHQANFRDPKKSGEYCKRGVVWLGSEACDVTGRVFEITGGHLNVCDGWQRGPVVESKDRLFAIGEIGEAVHTSISAAPKVAPVYGV